MTEPVGWGINAPITWSIDTTGLKRPQRARKAARTAFTQWQPTGHAFTYTPTGGDITIIFRTAGVHFPKEWGAYGQWTKVVPCPDGWRIVAGAVVCTDDDSVTKEWLQGALAHEIGHALALPHLGPDTVMGSPSTTKGRVTPADIAAEKRLQRPY